jgi:membrane protein implicated in regulation of membrane protease activity
MVVFRHEYGSRLLSGRDENMLALYWFTLGFGGIFLLVTVFFGADSDTDGHDFDAGAGGDAGDVVTGDVGQLHGDSHGHMGEASHPPVMDVFFFLLSLRFWAFFTAFFGLTGVGGHYLIGGGISTLVMAIIMGMIAGFSASYLFKYLSRGNVSSDFQMRDGVGQLAEVTVPLGPGDPGKVKLVIKGQLLELKAICEEAECAIRDKVTIVQFKDNAFIVAPVGAAASKTSNEEESNG